MNRTRFGAAVRPGQQPVMTYTVIAACVVVYVLQLLTSTSAGQSMTGYRLPDVTQALWYAPLHTSEYALHIGAFEPWRMLTSAFAHAPGNPTHLVFNMLAMWWIGRVIEPAIGRWRYGLLLLLSAFGGSVAVLLLTPFNVPTLGASGAVFGLFGALFILMRSTGAQNTSVVVLIVLQMAMSFIVPGISWQGHLGGLVTGALVALVVAKAPRENRNLWQGLGLGGVAVLLLILTWAGVTVLF